MSNETIDVRAAVAAAVDQAWPSFAAAHPSLAEAIDRRLFIERAAASLQSDPKFQQALSAAKVAEAIMRVVANAIARMLDVRP